MNLSPNHLHLSTLFKRKQYIVQSPRTNKNLSADLFFQTETGKILLMSEVKKTYQ